MREHYRDNERCAECGGRCCRIYLTGLEGGTQPETVWFEDWALQWQEEFEDCGASEIEPLFDPLEVHLTGNEHMLQQLYQRGIDPWACQYLLKDGCMLPWDKRPNTCKEYRCYDWRHDDEFEK